MKINELCITKQKSHNRNKLKPHDETKKITFFMWKEKNDAQKHSHVQFKRKVMWKTKTHTKCENKWLVKRSYVKINEFCKKILKIHTKTSTICQITE